MGWVKDMKARARRQQELQEELARAKAEEKRKAKIAKKAERYEWVEKNYLRDAKPGDIYVTMKVPMVGAEPFLRRGWEQVQTTRYTIGIQNFHTLRIPVEVLRERYPNG